MFELAKPLCIPHANGCANRDTNKYGRAERNGGKWESTLMSRINLCLVKPKANCKLIQLTKSSTTQKFVHYFGLVRFVFAYDISLFDLFLGIFSSSTPTYHTPRSSAMFCRCAWAFELQCQVIKPDISMAGVRSSDNARPINIILHLLLTL